MGGKGSGRKPAPCGTHAGYLRHRKFKEDCSVCKAAHADYKRSIYKAKPPRIKGLTPLQKHRELVRNEKLRRGSCLDCGLIIDERTIVCIDFDHRDPAEKSFTISYMMGRVHISDMIEEMAKCDAVCRNCHALRTHAGQHHLYRREPCTLQATLFDS